MRARRKRTGFSLTELLVVIAVILVLVSLLIIGMQSSYAHAVQLKCQHHLEQIGHALSMYTLGSHGCWPQAWQPATGKPWFHTLAMNYLSDPAVLACPTIGEPPLTTADGTPGQEIKREEADEVYKALRWLKSKQRVPGGTWDVGYRGRLDRWGQSSTGLALLAFLGFGCTDKRPSEFADTVRLAVEYLCSSSAQYKDGPDAGRFTQSRDKIYNQGICVMAVSAATQVVEDPALRAKARSTVRLALNWLVTAAEEADYGCFTYEAPYKADVDPHCDSNATSWFYHGIAAARDSGFSIPASVNAKAEEYFYWSYAGGSAGDGGGFYWFGVPNTRNGGTSAITTSVRLAAGIVMGHGPTAEDTIKLAENLYKKNRPTSKLLAMEAKSPQESHTYVTYFTNEAMVRLGGKYEAKWRADYFPHRLIAIMDPAGEDMAYWTNYDCHDIGGSWEARGEWGDVYATAMACMALVAGYSDYWLTVEGIPPTAEASYGYNNRIGLSRASVAGDTIVVMDYDNWQIDRDGVGEDDADTDIALRHQGQANVLLGDGRVQPLRLKDILSGMWTPEKGD